MKPRTATNPNGAGRSSKRTPATENRILEALREGCTRRAACGYAGVSEETFYQWLKRFPEFSESCTRAENEAEAGYTRVLQRAAQAGDWRAAESWLKRQRRADWGDNVNIEIDREISDLLAIVAAGGQAEATG